MARGRIPERDIAAIRERTPIEEIVAEYVQLKPGGADSLKGLSPFKDERTPSFHVRPNHGYYHCFSTGKGGDVFSFLMEMEHLSFPEAVEACAERIGYTINYEGGGTGRREEPGTRRRLVEANKAAHAFYRDQLEAPEAQVARDFLADRGFTEEQWRRFGCGYAPDGWDTMTRYLQRKGFSAQELEKAGLSTQGRRGPIDRFRRRLLWPIRNLSGDVIGFGARKLFEDDNLGKYMNTPDTLLYHKSKVLFGLDLAKKDIAASHRAIVVEGYTDVMAMHAAGETTAVAACGTAFGEGHLTVLRRLLLDDSFFRGELIYTFDGDEAGQKAAMRAFEGDQRFTGQSYVAVAPDGMDPCDLRMARGDVAVRSSSPRGRPSSSSSCAPSWRSTTWICRAAAWRPSTASCRCWRSWPTPRCATNTPARSPAGSASATRPRWCGWSARRPPTPRWARRSGAVLAGRRSGSASPRPAVARRRRCAPACTAPTPPIRA